MAAELHLEVMPAPMQRVFEALAPLVITEGFYLAGDLSRGVLRPKRVCWQSATHRATTGVKGATRGFLTVLYGNRPTRSIWG